MFSLFKKKEILDKAVQQEVARHIKQAESTTSGEIRVFVESKCTAADPLTRAKEIFAALHMHKTVARNAILVYLATDSKVFALFGDTAIYEQAGGQKFWESAAQKLKEQLSAKQYKEGLCNCIDELARVLAIAFPYDPAINKNELPDEIVFGK
jgi:uncharacterized membrane protein